MTSVMPSHGLLVVGTSGSPGSLPASRYAHDLGRRNVVPLLACQDRDRHRVAADDDISRRTCS
jgi:hypothetical protein